MNYSEIRPDIRLSNSVKCYWMLTGAAEDYDAEGIAPDGSVEMILNLADPFMRHYEQGRSNLQPTSFIVGQTLRSVVVQPTGRVEILGVRFHPHGFYRFIKQPIGEFSDKTVDCRDVWGSSVRLLEERIREAWGPSQKIKVVETFLLGFLEEQQPPGKTFEGIGAAVRLMQCSGGVLPIETIALAVGMSARHLERQFKAIVGLSPKSLQRLVRFQNALQLTRKGQTQGARIAIDGGYYDQAHFIRDFKTFTGHSPSAYSDEAHYLDHFFNRGEPVGFLQYPS